MTDAPRRASMVNITDQMSMAVGLEVRVPFCEHRLVECVHNAPWSLKTYDGVDRT
jgi:asparagine synthase (glutamine-hydrolysing)